MPADSIQSERRIRGRYYTPPRLARTIVAGCLDTRVEQELPRILDPACGDGAILLEAFDLLLGRRLAAMHGVRPPRDASAWTDRLAVVRESLFGVDRDAAAVAALRRRLEERIDSPSTAQHEMRAVLDANFRSGDALLGPDWSRDGSGFIAGTQFPYPSPPGPGGETGSREEGSATASQSASGTPHPIDWSAAFPHVASAGGFDVVAGNPPYRRERDTREVFRQLAASPLGRWKQPRMDLWHYFVHRGLDLLRPGGRLAYIVNGYWTAAAGAGRLIERLARETTIEEVRLLGDERVFSRVSGRHLIFRLCKATGGGPCRIADGEGSFQRPQADLFRGGTLVVARPDPIADRLDEQAARVGRVFDVRQGIAENPPRISPRFARRFPGPYEPGDGVFVLSADEIARLELAPAEVALLRPYSAQRRIGRFAAERDDGERLLYLTPQTAPDLDELPNLRRHLERFRPLLVRRREVERGTIAWWQLHWPREERLFVEPRILAPQMGRQPAFAYVERPLFVGFAVNVVVVGRRNRNAAEFHPPRQTDIPVGEPSAAGLSLVALCGILNSQPAARWFTQRAKRRGANLDIGGTLLRQFPLPPPCSERERALESLVLRRNAVAASATTRESRELEAQIERAVAHLYGLDS